MLTTPPKRVSLGLLVNFLLENHIFLSKNIYNHKNLPLSIKSPGLLVNVVNPLPPPEIFSWSLGAFNTQNNNFLLQVFILHINLPLALRSLGLLVNGVKSTAPPPQEIISWSLGEIYIGK